MRVKKRNQEMISNWLPKPLFQKLCRSAGQTFKPEQLLSNREVPIAISRQGGRRGEKALAGYLQMSLVGGLSAACFICSTRFLSASRSRSAKADAFCALASCSA